MIEFSETRDNVVIARVGGKVTAEDVDAVVDEAESKLSVYEQIGVVADLTDMESMTPEAVARDFAAQFKFLGSWKRFPKVAVIAEPGVLKGLSESMGAILPQIEVRTFSPSESEGALAFASSVESGHIHA